MSLLHMEVDLVRTAGYELRQTSGNTVQQTQQLGHAVQNLLANWQGPSANMFAAEVQPLLQQLHRLGLAGTLLDQRLQREVDEWEQVAGSFGGGLATAGIGFLGGDNPVSTLPGTVPHIPLPDKEWRFRPGDIIGYNPYEEAGWEHANRGKLAEAMPDLLNYLRENSHLLNPPYAMTAELEQRLYALATARGISPEKAMVEYAKFVQLLNGNVPDLITRLDYWGDVQQLRFGKVVGDTLGIDAVFGSLLSPSGGLVGPGDSALHDVIVGVFERANASDAILYHGVYHDAAGYLLREHGVGPGYEYILPGIVDSGLDAKLPLSVQLLLRRRPELNGQETGIAYWLLKMQAENAKSAVAAVSDVFTGKTTPQASGGGAW
jgi:uncharacterized protein YukE